MTKWGKRKAGGTDMFMGEYSHSMDEKGRVIVPVKFREELGSKFVLSLGLDGCLYLFPEEEWKEFALQLRKLPGSKKARELQRYFLGGANTCEVDKQGRMSINANQRQLAALDKDIVFVGVLNKIEVWSKERWDANNVYEDMDDIAEQMSELGLTF